MKRVLGVAVVVPLVASALVTAPSASAAVHPGHRDHVAAAGVPATSSVSADPHTLAAAATDVNGVQPGGITTTAAIAGSDGRLSIQSYTSPSRKKAAALISSLQTDPQVKAIGSPVRAEPAAASIANDVCRDPQFDMFHTEDTWAVAGTGTGSVIAVIDSGLVPNVYDLAGQTVSNGVDFSSDGNVNALNAAGGHGTEVALVASAIANNVHGSPGWAPGAKILPLKVQSQTTENGVPLMWSTWVASAITYAVDQHVDVINLSLSIYGNDPSVESAIDYAAANDITVVASSGNRRFDGNPTSWPAAYPSVLAVGALSPNLTDSGYSESGPYVDITAFGTATVNASTVYEPEHTNSCFTDNGTSISAPIVSAAVAIMRQKFPTWTSTQIIDRLTSTATDLGDPGKDDIFGYGALNLYKAVTGHDASPTAPHDEPSTLPTTPVPTQPVPTPAVPVVKPSKIKTLTWKKTRAGTAKFTWAAPSAGTAPVSYQYRLSKKNKPKKLSAWRSLGSITKWKKKLGKGKFKFVIRAVNSVGVSAQRTITIRL